MDAMQYQKDVEDREMKQEHETDADEAGLAERRRAIRDYCRDYIAETFGELGIAGAAETAQLSEGLRFIPLEERDIGEWERFLTHLNDMLHSGRELYIETVAVLESAVSGKLISGESKIKWIARLRDPMVNYKAKEYFVHYQFPSYVQSWERAKRQRDLLIRNPRIPHLTKGEVKDLAAFLNEDAFAALHFDKKVDLLSNVQAAVTARTTRQDALFHEAKGTIEAAAAAGVMSEDKVGVWLRRLFSHGFGAEETRAYYEGTLKKQYIPNWTKIRYAYDRAEREMDETEPQGFRRITPEKFLLLSYDQRVSYVEEAGRRVRAHRAFERGRQSKMQDLKLRIRHDLDTEDWEEAEELIARGEEIAEGEDVHELASMKRYLSAFRERSKENATPMKTVRDTLREMRNAFEQIPMGLRSLYLSSLTTGYPTLASLCSLVYNRIWCREHGFLDARKEKELEIRAADDTRCILRDGHRKRGRENVDLDIVDDFESAAAVRDYDNGECGATIIHYSPASKGKLLSKINRNAGFAFNYWVTLVPHDVSYGQQLYLVRNVNWVLKRGMRILRENGFGFSLTGEPIGLN